VVLFFFFGACFPSKEKIHKSSRLSVKADEIVANALTYKGVKYKYGGNTRRGMDCSGLVHLVFSEADYQLPRSSRNIAEEGRNIALKDVKKGDLLFFKISRISKAINHVGLVVSVDDDQIYFIHSTTSRGVIVSALSEKYWKKAFAKAKNIL
jgi:cell wall-associated NlpC family hydrolase